MSDPLDDENPEGPRQKDRDEVLRKKSFSRARGLDISSFMVKNDDSPEEPEQEDTEKEDHDIAMGEIVEIFSSGGDDTSAPGAVQKDGTVINAPEDEFLSSNTLSTNILTISPGKCIMIDGFPKTRESLENFGISVKVFNADELCIACEGGPTCLTRPLLRS